MPYIMATRARKNMDNFSQAERLSLEGKFICHGCGCILLKAEEHNRMGDLEFCNTCNKIKIDEQLSKSNPGNNERKVL